MTRFSLVFVLAAITACAARSAAPVAGYSPEECPACAEWNTPATPFRLYGSTYYVGTRGLAALLVTSSAGHVLIDGGLPESAPHIAANIEALGFRLRDVRLIVSSHAHFDHAGGVAALQRVSGARVLASPEAARVLRAGRTRPNDPQHSVHLSYPAVAKVAELGDGDTVRVGELALVARFTPGHTPGGTSWSWVSCADGVCVDFVYADSLTPVSADDFLFTRSSTYPTAIQDFERSFAVLERLRCDVLVTPHPGASRLWQRVQASSEADRLIDPEACRRYVAQAREALARRIAREREPQS